MPARDLAALNLLLSPLRTALRDRTVVVAQGLWQRFDLLGLLPFLLHTLWAQRVPELGLNATLSLIPFSPADHEMAKAPFCDPVDAHRARYRARAFRNESRTDLPSDFRHPDWEQGFAKHQEELAGTALPALAYLALDQVGPEGMLQPGRRPVLGKYAMGSNRILGANSPRPALLIPGRRLTPAACERLVESDLLIINVQGVRGPRLLQSVRDALEIRGWDRPTLLVAATPADTLALGVPELQTRASVVAVGPNPVPPTLDVVIVGRDRPQQEKACVFALLELRGFSPTVDRLVDLGINAWWRVQHSVAPALDDEPAARRFLLALEQRATEGDGEAVLFATFRKLLEDTAADQARIDERLEAIFSTVNSYLNLPGSRSAVVVVHPHAAVAVVEGYIASRWGLKDEEMQALGLSVVGDLLSERPDPLGLLVLNGFFGSSTIDSILGGGFRQASIVMDPVEARAMVKMTDRMDGWLAAGRVENSPLNSVREAAADYAVAPSGPSVHMGLDFTEAAPRSSADASATPPALAGGGRVIVFFTDGTFEVCDTAKRFDLVNPGMGRLQTAAAEDLQVGDEVVLTQEASQFSERLIASLDSGVLAKQAAQRSMWSTTVQTVSKAQNLKITATYARLRERGVHVDYQTVRAWLRGRGDQDAVPGKWEHFRQVTEVLGMALPEEELRNTYAAIRRLRVLHRKAGRDLVRLMRGAAMHRLDAYTLARIETVWGVTVRELIERTRIAVVDEVQGGD